MQFGYEIAEDDYVASQTLYHNLTAGSSRIKRAAPWVLAGIFFIVIVWNERVLNWAPVLLAAIGMWWIYAGIASLFPGGYFRRAYRGLGLAGKKFQASVNEEQFEVVGDFCSWRVRWEGVSLKGESKDVFIVCSENTIFMFAKKYLNDEQKRDLRKLLALPST